MNIIKEVRKDLKLTQQQLADELGLTHSTICSYELGRRKPSKQVLKAICDKWNYNIDYLLSGKGDKYLYSTEQQYNTSDPFIVDFIESYKSMSEAQKNILKSFLNNFNIISNDNQENQSGNTVVKKEII